MVNKSRLILDLTHFTKQHPGGKFSILDKAGKDATEIFDMSHIKAKDNLQKLEKYCIGELVEEIQQTTVNVKEPTVEDEAYKYHFEACISKNEPVNNVFVKYLEKIESKGKNLNLTLRTC